ncbi:MAG: hypothetical protein GC134_07295 [Proteobacteria bacterium]|nr:hypothetical protein [Pseudomonadota bacterium]
MKKILLLVPVCAALAGCQTTQQAYAPYPPAFMAQESNAQMMAGRAISEVNSLDERVRRVERAMIRLDRRMQVIERNELARISSLGESTEGGIQPTGYGVVSEQGTNFTQVTSPFARGAAASTRGVQQLPVASFQQVAHNMPAQEVITSTLQPAPAMAKPLTQQAAPQSFGLPSLADKEPKVKEEAEASVAIWTVKYEDRKVWPSRDQLSSSRTVVEALRDDKPVALFARGARPASKEFRERVRAISRYLGRVSNVASVPIASMPADHLDENTIEIVVAR